MPRVDCFLLCDAAQVSGGKLYILGGGWSRLSTTSLPVTRAFQLAVRVLVPWTETNQRLRFELQLLDEDGAAVLEHTVRADISVGRPVHLAEGTEQSVPFTLELPRVRLERAGRYAFTLSHDGREQARTAFDLQIKATSSRSASAP